MVGKFWERGYNIPLKKKGFILQSKGAHLEKIYRRAMSVKIISAVLRTAQHGPLHFKFVSTPMLYLHHQHWKVKLCHIKNPLNLQK